MKKFKLIYTVETGSLGCSSECEAIIPAISLKQALTRFNAAGFEGTIICAFDLDFDISHFNIY